MEAIGVFAGGARDGNHGVADWCFSAFSFRALFLGKALGGIWWLRINLM